MFAKSLMVFTILLASTQGEPTTQPSQLSKIIAPHVEEAALPKNMNEDESTPQLSELSKISALHAERKLNDVAPNAGINLTDAIYIAIENCKDAAMDLGPGLLGYEIDLFQRSFDRINNNYQDICHKEHQNNYWPIYEYSLKVEENHKDKFDIVGEKCFSSWYNLMYFERNQMQAILNENLHKFLGKYRTIQYQNDYELNLIRSDLIKLATQAWNCEHDDHCLQIVLRRVKIYAAYIHYDFTAKINDSYKEVFTSSKQVQANLNKLLQEIPQKFRALADGYFKCAEKILA